MAWSISTGNTGEEIEQPADLVVLCAYPFNNTLLLLTAGIGEPYDPVTAKAWSARIIASRPIQA